MTPLIGKTMRLGCLLVLLLCSLPLLAADKSTSVLVDGKKAVVTIYPDVYSVNQFAKITKATSRQPNTNWFEVPLRENADGTKSATIVGSGQHEIRFLENNLILPNRIYFSADVYIPFSSPTNAFALAKKYAPISMFNSGEKAFPVSLESTFNNEDLIGNSVDVVVQTAGLQGEDKVSVALDQLGDFLSNNIGRHSRLNPGIVEQTCHETLYTCTPHPLRRIVGSRDKITVYWHLSSEFGKDYLSYYYFYAIDYKNGSVRNPAPAAHVLDRESFTIEFDTSTGEHVPLSVTYGAHLDNQIMLFTGYAKPDVDNNVIASWKGGRTKLAWNDAIKVGDHPVVYMAEGSHGIFPAQGWYRVTQSYSDELIKLDEQAGSSVGSKIVFPTSESLDLVELPVREKGVLNFSGKFVKLITGSAKYPPFAGRLPASNWVSYAEHFLHSCDDFDGVSQCGGLEPFLERPFGVRGWRAIKVHVDNRTGAELLGPKVIELRARNRNNQFFELEKKELNEDGTVEFFVESDSTYYGVYFNGKVCGEFSDEDVGFETAVNYIQAHTQACAVEAIEPEPVGSETEQSDETDITGDEPLPDEGTVNDTEVEANGNFSVGNLTVELSYPDITTDDTDGTRRNSIRWYFENPDEKLFVAECSTRKAVRSDREEGDPRDWAEIAVTLGRAGIALERPIQRSILACIGIASRTYGGVSSAPMSFEDAVAEAHCENIQTRPDGFNSSFRDDYDFNQLCSADQLASAANSTPDSTPADEPSDEFVLVLPSENTETNAGVRNSIAWYIANADTKLHSSECATRPMGGFVVGSGSNVIVNPGIIVDTGTGVVVPPGIVGWEAVSNILERNGVGLHRTIQKSVLACQLVLALLNLDENPDYAAAVKQATFDGRAGVFEDE